GIDPQECWLVNYTAHGRRHIKTFAKKKDADDYAATVLVDIKAGRHTAPSRSLTVAEGAARWLERVENEGRERTTLRQYRQHVNLHIAPRLGPMKLADLNHATVESFASWMLRDKKLSRPLARKVLTSLKSLLKVNQYSHLAGDVSINGDNGRERLEIGKDIPRPEEVRRLLVAAVAGSDKGPRKRPPPLPPPLFPPPPP